MGHVLNPNTRGVGYDVEQVMNNGVFGFHAVQCFFKDKQNDGAFTPLHDRWVGMAWSDQK